MTTATKHKFAGNSIQIDFFSLSQSLSVYLFGNKFCVDFSRVTRKYLHNHKWLPESRKFTQEYHKSFHDNAKYAPKILLHTLQRRHERASLSFCACLFMWTTQRLQKQTATNRQATSTTIATTSPGCLFGICTHIKLSIRAAKI